MKRAQEHCARAIGHAGKHLTSTAVQRMNHLQSEYHSEQRKQRYKKINAYKLAKGCIDCGYAEHPAALDLDHRDPELKVLNVAAMLTYSWSRILAELDKCDVRCACCHRVKTFNMGQNRRKPVINQVDDGLTDEI